MLIAAIGLIGLYCWGCLVVAAGANKHERYVARAMGKPVSRWPSLAEVICGSVLWVIWACLGVGMAMTILLMIAHAIAWSGEI